MVQFKAKIKNNFLKVLYILPLIALGAVLYIGCSNDVVRAGSVSVGTTPFRTSDYKIFENSDSLTLENEPNFFNTKKELINPSDGFRVRAGIRSTSFGVKYVGRGDSASGVTCFIAEDDKPYCIVNTSTAYEIVPVDLSGDLAGKTVKTIAATYNSVCMLTSDDLVYCWGRNNYGQLGNNSIIDSDVPVAVDMSGALLGKTVKKLAVGGSSACVIASDDQVYCWGRNNYGQLGNDSTTTSTVPVAVNTDGVLSGKTVTDLDVGGGFACVIASDNQTYCWGDQSSGRLGNGVSSSYSDVPVAVNTSGVLAGKTVSSVSLGGKSACVIASDSKVYCWGEGDFGMLGRGSTVDSSTPVAVDGTNGINSETITSISLGSNHACALTEDMDIYCWGNNSRGSYGNGTTTSSQIPVVVNDTGVLSGKTISSIQAAGANRTCAIDSDSNGYCWGYELDIIRSKNYAIDVLTPKLIDDVGATIPAEDNDFKLQYAELTESDCDSQTSGFADVTSSTPIAYNTNPSVTNGVAISSVTSGADLLEVSNKSFQSYVSGTGSFTNNVDINSAQDGLWDFSLRDNHAPIDKDYCVRIVYNDGTSLESNTQTPHIKTSHYDSVPYRFYGDSDSVTPGSPIADTNEPGQLQQPNEEFRLRTGIGVSGRKIKFIASGSEHSCYITTDDKTYCWGDNDGGELGDGSDTSFSFPVPIDVSNLPGSGELLSIAGGGIHTCAIASDHQAYCWGDRNDGALGNSEYLDGSNIPIPVDDTGVLAGKTILSIGAGYHFTCAIASDHKVYCWGDQMSGELGDGNYDVGSSVPVAVDNSNLPGDGTVKSLSVGEEHACVIASDDKPYCWGLNNDGTLGNGTYYEDADIPVPVTTDPYLPGDGTVKAISSGMYHTCAIASNDQAYCWGDGYYGQLGQGEEDRALYPTAVDTSGVLSGKTIKEIHGTKGNSTCAIASDDQVYCWGANDSGQLGNNSTDDVSIPVAVDTTGVLADQTVTAISSGYDFTCALASDEQAYCWGYNVSGQLGNYSEDDSSVPVGVYSENSKKEITPGEATYELQYAKLTENTCSSQTSGFASVTSSTPIAYNDNPSVSNGEPISSNENDPLESTFAVHQSFVSSGIDFANVQSVSVNRGALWDFSLKDNNAEANTTYCLRIAYGNGNNPIAGAEGQSLVLGDIDMHDIGDGVVYYPEIRTAGSTSQGDDPEPGTDNDVDIEPETDVNVDESDKLSETGDSQFVTIVLGIIILSLGSFGLFIRIRKNRL